LFDAYGLQEGDAMTVQGVVIGGKRFDFSENRQELVVLRPDDFDTILNLNTTNRKLDRKWIDELFRRLVSGIWIYNGTPLAISNRGTLLNGQHRLHAFRRYGKPVECLIVCGISEEAWATFDGDKRRTLNQELARDGVRNARAVASLTRTVWTYMNSRYDGDRGTCVTITELEGTLKQYPDIVEAVSLAESSKSLRSIGSGTSIAFMFWAGKRILDAKKFDEMVGIMRGEYPADGSNVVFMFRERIMRNKMSKARLPMVELHAIAIKCINSVKLDKSPKYLRWHSGGNEPFPIIEGLPPTHQR